MENSFQFEYELTYLAKYMPPEILNSEHIYIHDSYFPEAYGEHPHLRLRRSGNEYYITKKVKINPMDSSEQEETTIRLTKYQFNLLMSPNSLSIKKRWYKTVIDSYPADVDIFTDSLNGLVLIEFEFDSSKNKKKFIPPNCCLADVTQEEFIAGGMLAGKTLSELKLDLDKFGYQSLQYKGSSD